MLPGQISVYGLTFHTYGLIIGIAILVGVWVTTLAWRKTIQRGERLSLTEAHIWQGLWWVILGGVIGARLYHVLDYWEFYRGSFFEMAAVWRGGLGIYGGLMGAGVALWIYARWRKISWNEAVDLGVLGLAIGQAIGRWGNYVNQELYGSPSRLPWAVMILPENRLKGYETIAFYHPLFLYESLGMLMVFGLLWYLFWRKYLWKVGTLGYLSTYLIGYGVVRFGLEPLRLESWRWGVIPMAQLLSVIAIVIGTSLWYTRIRSAR